MKKGFTLIEILLVIAIIAVLSVLAVPIGMNFYRSQVVESVRGELMETLSKARRQAVLMKGDSRYGVVINTIGETLDDFTLYKGDSYDSRVADFDELYTQISGLTITATGTADLLAGDINFAKLVGTTTATGTITIRHNGGESRSILIDDFGNAYER